MQGSHEQTRYYCFVPGSVNSLSKSEISVTILFSWSDVHAYTYLINLSDIYIPGMFQFDIFCIYGIYAEYLCKPCVKIRDIKIYRYSRRAEQCNPIHFNTTVHNVRSKTWNNRA